MLAFFSPPVTRRQRGKGPQRRTRAAPGPRARNCARHGARGEGVSEGEQNLQERIVLNARDFSGSTLGRLKGHLRGESAQLKDLA